MVCWDGSFGALSLSGLWIRKEVCKAEFQRWNGSYRVTVALANTQDVTPLVAAQARAPTTPQPASLQLASGFSGKERLEQAMVFMHIPTHTHEEHGKAALDV